MTRGLGKWITEATAEQQDQNSPSEAQFNQLINEMFSEVPPMAAVVVMERSKAVERLLGWGISDGRLYQRRKARKATRRNAARWSKR